MLIILASQVCGSVMLCEPEKYEASIARNGSIHTDLHENQSPSLRFEMVGTHTVPGILLGI